MGKFAIVTRDSVPMVVSSDLVQPELQGALPAIPDHELHNTSLRFYFDGDAAGMQLWEVSVEPNLKVSPHAHEQGEIIFVTDGALRFGAQVCRAGTAIFVPGETLYGFEAGPDGATFLNFRARADHSYLSKAEFAARYSEGSRTTR